MLYLSQSRCIRNAPEVAGILQSLQSLLFSKGQERSTSGWKCNFGLSLFFSPKKNGRKAMTDKSPRTLSLPERAIRASSKPYNPPECISNAMIQLSRCEFLNGIIARGCIMQRDTWTTRAIKDIMRLMGDSQFTPRRIRGAHGYGINAWNNFDICGMRWRCGLWMQFGAPLSESCISVSFAVLSARYRSFVPAKPYRADISREKWRIVVVIHLGRDLLYT